MRVPNFIYAEDIKSNTTQVKFDGIYFVAKKSYFYGLCIRRRLYLAWCVFIGRYDVVFFEEDRQKMK